MTDTNDDIAPRMLAGCDVLPAMEPASPIVYQTNGTSENLQAKTKKGSERFHTFNNFVDFTAGTLSRCDLLVWLILFRDARDGMARTSQSEIARRAGMSDRTVRRALKKLASRGLVKVVRQGGINRGTSSYRVFPLDGNK